MSKLAILVLENGIIFHGKSVGIEGSRVGEVVFNTSMTGYQEIITDPSYFNQIVVLTSSHIGNVGINIHDEESNKIYASGLITANITAISYHYKNKESFINYVKRNNLIVITDIDTRKLTRTLRKLGSLKGCLYTEYQENYYSAYVKSILFNGLKNADLAKQVSTNFMYKWNNEIVNSNLCFNYTKLIQHYTTIHIVVYDFGVKFNILRLLSNFGCQITIVPAQATAENVLNLRPDGIFLSNGPGDPKPCTYAINMIKFFLKKNIPIFGICLGHQLLALANGANIIKMRCGHHGSNHPVLDLATNQVMITSQNHGFAVDLKNIPSTIKVTHVSLFDGTLQGLSLKNKLAFSFQGHPESSPGPHDTKSFFQKFINIVYDNKNKKIKNKLRI